MASENYGEFIRNSLEFALAGDGEAQYYIAQAVLYCRGARAMYRDGTVTADWIIDQSRDSYSEVMRQQFQLHHKRCVDIARADPFAALPTAIHKYSWEYWLAQAASNGNADAIADKANLNSVQNPQTGIDKEKRVPQQVSVPPSAVVATFEEKDFPKLSRLVPVLNKASNARPDAGFALLLAACDLGMPCNGPDVTDPACQTNLGSCIPDGQFRDYVMKQVGQARYGQVLVMSDRLVQAHKQNDRDEIQRILFRK